MNDDDPTGENTFCYVARKSCGHTVMATVDCPEMADANAKEIARCIKGGMTIERQTVAWVRAGGLTFCDCEKTKKAKGGDDLFTGFKLTPKSDV